MPLDMTYKLYVFDLDGTLADTKLDIGRALQKVMGEAGFTEPSLDAVEMAIGGGARKALLKLTGMEDTALDPLLKGFVKAYEDMCCDNTLAYEGAEELLNKLKALGARIAVVTMKFRVPTHKILTHLGLFDLFDAVVTFDDVEKRKPDPDSLFVLQRQFGVAAADTLMVGDSMTDLGYAKAAGVDACAVTYGYGVLEDLEAAHPRYTISVLSEML